MIDEKELDDRFENIRDFFDKIIIVMDSLERRVTELEGGEDE